MALDVTVTISGTPTERDIRGAHLIIDLENERRAALEEPLSPLPKGTAAQLKSSYEFLLKLIIIQAHLSYIEQADRKSLDSVAAEAWKNATDAQRQAALDALGV